MPYIKQENREKLNKSIEHLSIDLDLLEIENKGDMAGNMNYSITKLIVNIYGPIENLKYQDFNEIIGILESCKLEFYRRMVAPYEDIKERENGEV